MLDLKLFAREFVENRRHCDGPETAADRAVIEAINQRDRKIADRKESVVAWLNYYKVFMGLVADSRISIAGEVLGFADGRLVESLHRDKKQNCFRVQQTKESN